MKIIMERIKDLFTINDIHIEENDATKCFKAKAKELFEHCYFQQGEVVFSFLEIEFYYHSEKHKDDKKDGTPFVYSRKKGARPAQFFIHSSGLDLCFSSEDGFGGILIRSLLRIDNNQMSVVTGPWDCMDALFDYTGGVDNIYPRLLYTDEATTVNLGMARRANVPNGCQMGKRHYCFYDKNYQRADGKWGEKDAESPFRRFSAKDAELIDNKYTQKPWNRTV